MRVDLSWCSNRSSVGEDSVCSSALTVRVYCDSCHNRNGLEDVRDGNYFHCILQRCSFSGLSVVVFYVAKWLDNRVCSGVADTSPLYRPRSTQVGMSGGFHCLERGRGTATYSVFWCHVFTCLF